VTVFADSRIGTELAGYRLDALVGRGGMSVVYRAEHLRLKRDAAVKLLAPELADDARFRERFLRESEVAASLDHPNIVRVYDAGESEGLLYLAMQYVDGIDLKALLRREGALERERAIAIVAQVADALDAAHARGLVHRDVKPSNVLVAGAPGEERCYLADFGLTKLAAERTALTDAGQMLGTIDYIAPEQIRGDAVDGRADVYSLACLLYHCLTGRAPFTRDTDVAVIYAHLEETPPGTGDPVDDVLAKGMAKEREERWPSCGALIDAARAAPAAPASARARVRALAGAGTLAVAAAVAGLLLVRGGGPAAAHAAGVGRIDPDGARLTSSVTVPGRPRTITTCAGSVFVAGLDGVVSVIDPRTQKPYAVHVGAPPRDISHIGGLATVVGGPPKNTVTIIDGATGTVSGAVALPGRPREAAVVTSYGRDVWVANPSAGELDRVGPPYTGVAERIPLPRLRGRTGYAGVAAGEGAVWIAGNDVDRTLLRFDPATRAVASIRLPFAPRAIAVGYGGVWLVDGAGTAVVRVDPKTSRIGPRIRAGRGARAVAVGGGFVWVANELDRSVSRIDPQRNAVDREIGVGARPLDLAVGLGAVWVVRGKD
jgi:DNA-binding beta-propeller fold protein YncE/tRNA A-37 threonylcarbamoyl transferase component Bud32